MNKEALRLGHEAKKALLRKAIKEGIYLIMPRNTSPIQWSVQRKIGFRYAFQDKTLREIGAYYGKRQGTSRRLNHKFLDNIHGNFPPELQVQYPRETIPDRKPLGQKSRERQSEAQGGLSLKVKGLVEGGITDPKQIMDILNISHRELWRARKTLKELDIDIPPTTKSTISTIKEALESTQKEADKKLQELLYSSSASSLISSLERDFSHETLTTVSIIAREKGFRFHNRQIKSIAEKIKAAGIPVRPTPYTYSKGKLPYFYYIVYSKHTERIAEVLRNDPDLQRFR